MKCFDRSLSLSPRNIRVIASKGIALRELDRLSESLACFNRALELNAVNSFVWFHKSLTLRKMGRDKEADECVARINFPVPRFS
ncbi:MAG: Tetratricopeptide repeat protein [Methanoregulaceae archaeon PtaU1.Bin222]|nr:MAG: Tetratricopeptide repeat protein [Methanoregulaceae archaeon PtaU1.Bin222]